MRNWTDVGRVFSVLALEVPALFVSGATCTQPSITLYRKKTDSEDSINLQKKMKMKKYRKKQRNIS